MPTVNGGIKISKGRLVKGDLPVGLPFKASGWKSTKAPEGVKIEEDVNNRPKSKPKKKASKRGKK